MSVLSAFFSCYQSDHLSWNIKEKQVSYMYCSNFLYLVPLKLNTDQQSRSKLTQQISAQNSECRDVACKEMTTTLEVRDGTSQLGSYRCWLIIIFWLFLPKHKLELMFSTIEHYAPRRHHLAGNLFPALRTTNTFSCPPLFLPANEKMVSTCSQTASQSALHSLLLFMLQIPVDLHLQFSQAAGLKRLFPHPPSPFLSYLYRCLSLIESCSVGC